MLQKNFFIMGHLRVTESQQLQILVCGCLATGCKTEISSTVVLTGPLSIHSVVRNALTAGAAASNSDAAVTSTECTRPPGFWKEARHVRSSTRIPLGLLCLFAYSKNFFAASPVV
jgi:hypothetical protein